MHKFSPFEERIFQCRSQKFDTLIQVAVCKNLASDVEKFHLSDKTLEFEKKLSEKQKTSFNCYFIF